MDRIIFKKEIDSIYEKLYSVNEGLSSVESNDFIKGYQDGIEEGYKIFLEHINEENPFIFVKEGIGKWAGNLMGGAKGLFQQGAKAVSGAASSVASGVGKAASGIASGVGSAVGAAKGLYQQGANMAASAWKSVSDFATQVINKIKTGITTAASWVAAQPAKIKEDFPGIYNQAVSDMKSAFEALKDKAQELAQSITNIWNSVLEGIKSAIETAKTKIVQTEEAAKAWFDKNKQLVIAQATEWQNSTIQWLQAAGKTVLEATQKVASGALTALKVVGLCVATLVVGPVILLVKGIQQIPALYQMAKNQVDSGISAIGDWWVKQQEDYVKGWNQSMATTGVAKQPVPGRDPNTGRMTPAGTAPTPTGERRVLSFTDFLNEKKKGMNKKAFLEMINKKKGKGKGKDECDCDCKKK